MIATGAIFYSIKTSRSLFLLRNATRYPNTWGLVGGKMQSGETVIQALNREIQEELGLMPSIIKYIPLETYTSSSIKFKYHTFICLVEDEFIPILNHEHSGFCWAPIANFPKPLHPGLYTTLNLKEVKQKLQILENQSLTEKAG